jgi:hypothetical protein
MTITVTVTDAAGNTITKSTTATAMDPAQAGRLSSLCRLLESLHEFRWPIYINPGDPGPVSTPAYSPAALQRLHDLANGLVETVEGLRQAANRE